MEDTPATATAEDIAAATDPLPPTAQPIPTLAFRTLKLGDVVVARHEQDGLLVDSPALVTRIYIARTVNVHVLPDEADAFCLHSQQFIDREDAKAQGWFWP